MARSRCFMILFIFIVVLNCSHSKKTTTQEFHIDYEKNTFVKDGKAFRYVSGSIHPYRVPRSLWKDRLGKMWAAGLNAIQVYVFWNEHEQYPGVFDFNGKNDIYTFIKMAQATGFLVILRAGPYACAEHEFGGLPWWLLSDRSNPVIARSSDPRFMKVVERFYSVLLPPIEPLLYNNGGPIIMVQIENEYGNFGCDSNYLIQLRDIYRSHLGDNVVYFTTDNSVDYCVKCGKIPGVYSTVDFGVGDNATRSFEIQRMVSPNGPLVDSEFWTGWIDPWGSKHTRTSSQVIVSLFHQILDFGANLNFYMFHGGTNFGFSNGAVHPYVPVITSYDYDAPISESGDTTEKYTAMRQAISKYLPLPSTPIPANSTKTAYGRIQMEYVSSLVDFIVDSSGDNCIDSQYPKSFEELGQGHGFILYSTRLNTSDLFGKTLSIPHLGDRAYVQIGSVSVGIIQRNSNTSSIMINLKDVQDSTLNIIVENTGRLNVDRMDPKGILSNVTLDGEILENWHTCLTDSFIPYYQHDITRHPMAKLAERKSNSTTSTGPGIYMGIWYTKSLNETFIKMDQFTKGVAFVLSRYTVTNLGRYWPSVGPQHALYVPTEFASGSFSNIVTLIEFESAMCDDPADCYIESIDYPILN